MKRETTAVFIGNRDCYGIDTRCIQKSIKYAINSGITTFLSGGQGDFDRICASQVYKLKKEYPNIKNILVIPYIDFRIFNKDIFDEIIFPFEAQISSYYSYKSAIPERNRIMVSWSRMAISFVYKNGGASKNLELAKNKNLEIIDISSLT